MVSSDRRERPSNHEDSGLLPQAFAAANSSLAVG